MRKLRINSKTLKAAVKKLGARPYKKQKTPQLDKRIREQRLAYTEIGPVAQMMKKGEWEAKKHTIAWIDHTPTSKTGAVNSSHDPYWCTPEEKKKEGIPSAGSSKYGVKPQVFLLASLSNATL